jgi:hypothetical protein
MSGVVEVIEDAFNAVIDAVEDLVTEVWDAVLEPILEEVFSWFGIVDETVVTMEHLSSPIFSDNTDDVVDKAIVRAILAKIKTDTDFFPNYINEIFKTKGELRSYFNYANVGPYYAGLPEMEIGGTIVDFDLIQGAIDTETGSVSFVLDANQGYLSPERYWQQYLQPSPRGVAAAGGLSDYIPSTNTLTYTDPDGGEYSDWLWGSIAFNGVDLDYDVTISRDADTCQFRVDGPKQITEGDTATYTVRASQAIPAGQTLQVNITYGGTAINLTDYTQVASVTFNEFETEKTFDLVTIETGNANRTITVDITPVNTGPVFEQVLAYAQGSPAVTTTITDNDTLRLNIDDHFVVEANTTITVSVELPLVAPSGAFSVDYGFTDLGTITGGVDYDNTTGTLNFAGTAGEVQQFTVNIYADVADDDLEQFEIFLHNSTDLDSIDTSVVSTVTIYDGSDFANLNPLVSRVEVATVPDFTRVESTMVTYEDTNDAPGNIWYWSLPATDLTYGDLRAQYSHVTNLEMMPMVILRKEKKSIDVLYGTSDPKYIQSQGMMRRLNFVLEDFIEAIDSNPDEDLIDDAYFHFSVNPLDTGPSSGALSKLLWEAWFSILVTSGIESNTGEYKAMIKEGDIENALVWNSHTYTFDISGVKTTEGAYLHEVVGTSMTCWYQRTATEYDELAINTINGMYSIKYDGYSDVALNVLGDEAFNIPISWDTFARLTATEQMEIYEYICRLDFNAVSIVELEWYETEAFFDFFSFALVVISIITIGFTSPLALALNLIYTYVINWAVAELIIFVAELTGNEVLAALVGVIAAVWLNNPQLLSSGQLLQAESLINMATDFADNLALLDNIEAQELAEDLLEAQEEAQERIDEEKENRDDIETVSVDASFIVALQSIDTNYFPAIEGQYSYDATYDYDSLVGNWHEQQLSIGVT